MERLRRALAERWAAAQSWGDRLPPAMRGRRRWLLLGVASFVVIAVLLATRLASPTPEQIGPNTHVFFINGPAHVTFSDAIGSVHITPGTDGQVRVQEQRNGITDAITVHYVQNGNTIAIMATIPSGLYEDTWVDFMVSVPEHADLTTTVPTGTLTVDGLSGNISLTDTNGSIWASGLAGAITLATQSGSVNAEHVNGQLSATTTNGTITTADTHLSGSCILQAQSGTINFHGSLDRNGRFVFRNTNGAVGLTLPPSSTFSLAARTQNGAINAGFAGITDTRSRAGLLARGDVGPPPRPQVMIETTSGSIDISQGG
jgi:Putative adhesin